MLAFSAGTAAADTPPADPAEVLEGVTELLPAELLPSAPQPPAPPAEDDGAAESQRAPLPGPLLGGEEPTDETPVEPEGDDVAPAPEAPNPAAELCAELEAGLGAIPEPLGAPLTELIGEICALAEADPLAELQELLEGLLAGLPSLTDPAAGCQALIDLFEQGGEALGLDPAALTGLIAQLCALIPAPTTPEAPKPQPQPQPAAQPVVHPQPQQHPQPAVAPVASRQATPSGQLAYTGSEPTPYLAGGLIALGLGTGLTLLGRRRVESDA